MNAPIATPDKTVSLVDAEAIKHARSSTEHRPERIDPDNLDHGRDADTPSQIPPLGWRDIGWRLWEEFNKDRVLLIAAGATFYLLLALFPALAAFVSLYGFVADPATVADHVAYLGSMLPTGGLDLIRSSCKHWRARTTARSASASSSAWRLRCGAPTAASRRSSTP